MAQMQSEAEYIQIGQNELHKFCISSSLKTKLGIFFQDNLY
jgi:hypothetical protein